MTPEYERSCGEATLEAVTEMAAVLSQMQKSLETCEHLLTLLCRGWEIIP